MKLHLIFMNSSAAFIAQYAVDRMNGKHIAESRNILIREFRPFFLYVNFEIFYLTKCRNQYKNSLHEDVNGKGYQSRVYSFKTIDLFKRRVECW